MLEELLKNFDDGRLKSFYCVVVNLLDLQDIKNAMGQIDDAEVFDTPLKIKAAAIVRLFEDMAEKMGISLLLRKKTK